MSSATASRKETERTKLIQEKCQTLLTQMLRDEDNKYCVDCDAKGPRWASWNLGVFLCIRCAGIHRNLGVHISRVKSVNLDTWTPEQVISLQQMGNSRARAVYEAQLPDGFRRPQTDTALESFIRAKYEHKKYLAREWVPPSPPKVDWAKEIDEELERLKRKKKAAQANSALGIGVLSGTASAGVNTDRKTSNSKATPLPAPLPKPKAGQSGSSPKSHRTTVPVPASGSGVTAATDNSNQSNDLLGLSSPTKPNSNDMHNDSFSGFLCATPAATSVAGTNDNESNLNVVTANTNGSGSHNTQNSLAKEEEDFFNQGSLVGMEKDKSGKLTKDSILALYGTAPSNPGGGHNPHNPQFGQPQHPMFVATGGAYGGMAPSYMPQQAQFMTPPNSTSMYSAPVMTAPAEFTPAGPGGAMGIQQMGPTGSMVGYGGTGTQYPGMGNAALTAGFAQQMLLSGSGGMNNIPTAGGIMTTVQQQQQQSVLASNLNLMQSNQSLLSGITMGGPAGSPGQSQLGHSGIPPMMGGMTNTLPNYQAPSAASTANLNQQFGNLNIGNVWQ